MASYYVDTNVLVGYTFLHNRWQDHTRRLMASENTLYAGDTVLYEYCVNVGYGPRDGEPLDWSQEDGVIGKEKRKLRKRKRFTYLELKTRDDLNPETVSKIFIEKFDVEEQIEHKAKEYFEKELDQDCTLDDVESSLNKLINRINSTAIDRKDEVRKRIKIRRRRKEKDYTTPCSQMSRIIDGEEDEYSPDAEVLTDAMDLKDRFLIDTVVTGDKGDMIYNKNKIEPITRLNLVYLKNKFANEDPEIDEEIPIDQDLA
ncbi:hypothetical protein HYG81_19045 (plasmid) [Natrinema zhouii]|uniref:hypothetical protein n=1 Tax=Natrinema zhouii TaxID=1710539 RepID=UPI001CFFAF83|nr:hypothetical protein [Natrinema zhouii]UHQ98197.1 hypothetical protein HYG81_19045 [Natrinema zhouii]